MKWLMRMLGKAKKDRHGFTLIELMIVLIIVAILAVAAVPTYRYFVSRAYESEGSASLGAMKTAEVVHWAEHTYYANTWTELGMTSVDFTNNKWFEYGCFFLSGVSTDFTALVDGDKSTKSEVHGIWLKLTKDSDVMKAIAADFAASVDVDGTAWVVSP